MPEVLIASLVLSSLALPSGQVPEPAPAREQRQREEPEASPTHWSIDMFAGSGLSIGNSRRWNGLRFNARDHGVDTINGVNVTVWSPHDDAVEQLNGMALGFATRAADTRGVSVGLLAVTAGARARWLQLGGLAVVSEGALEGANVSGLATVAEDGIAGITLSGLATVSEGCLDGLSLAGLATIAEGDMTGLNVAGLATVAKGSMTGLSVSGIATVAEGAMTGVSVAGLATVAEGDLTGLNVAGLATVTQGDLEGVALAGFAVSAGGGDDMWDLDPTAWTGDDHSASGLMVALYRVEARRLTGVSVAGIVNRAHDFTGVGISAYNAVSGAQRGLTVGLFNHAEHLGGLQIGLLNHVPDNPPWLRWLPLFNAPF